MRNRKSVGNFDPSRYAWVNIRELEVVLQVSEDPESGVGVGPEIVLVVRAFPRSYVYLNLSNMNHIELEALKEIFTTAIDWAEPICIARDKEAEDAAREGDDSYIRNYRPIPQLVFRKRLERERSEGLLHGSQDVTPGSEGGSDSAGPLREGVGSVAELDEIPSSSENNTEETGGTQVL